MADKILYGLRIRKDGEDSDLHVDKSAAIYVKKDRDWTNTVLLPTDKAIFWGSAIDTNNPGLYVDATGVPIVTFNGVETPITGGGGSQSSAARFASAEGATVANDNTEETLIPSGWNGTTQVTALTVFKVFRIVARGIYGTAALAPTIQLRLKLDTTTIIDTGTVTLAGAVTNEWWEVEADIVVRVDDPVVGEIVGNGTFGYSVGAGIQHVAPMTLTSSVTFDTTTTPNIDFTVLWGTADADNTITCQTITIEILDAPDA